MVKNHKKTFSPNRMNQWINKCVALKLNYTKYIPNENSQNCFRFIFKTFLCRISAHRISHELQNSRRPVSTLVPTSPHCKRCSHWHCSFFLLFYNRTACACTGSCPIKVNVIRPYLLQLYTRRQLWLARWQIAADCHLHAHILRRRTQSHQQIISFKFAHVIRFRFAPVIAFIFFFSVWLLVLFSVERLPSCKWIQRTKEKNKIIHVQFERV